MTTHGPNTGLGSWPRRRARISPTRPALVQDEHVLTSAGLADRVALLAGALRGLGVRPGDRVAYLGVNDVAVFETFFATGLLGAIFVPLNTRLAGPGVRHLLADSGASVLVHSPDTDTLLAAAGPLPDGLRHVLALRPDTCPAGGRDYEAEIAAAQPADEAVVGLDDVCVLLYTSGTTGTPKGAALTHGNLTWNTVNQLAHVDFASTDRALCTAPLFHCTGLCQITLPTLFKGGSVEPVPRFDPGALLARIGRARATSFAAVPTMLQRMCDHPSWPDADLSSLRCVNYGGSPVAERVARAWLDRGVVVLQGYGMTEASPGVCMAVPEGAAAHPVSVGVPHFFTDVASLRGGVPSEVDDEPAEVLVRGPHVFAGYWGRPEESAAAFTDGWFRTGDVLRTAPDGWAVVVDRVADVFISGGENVHPAEVEAVLSRLDGVADCAVVGVPDERWGETGFAWVVPREGARLDEAALRAELATRLAGYQVPRRVVFVEELPRNATGKIRRAELRGLAREEIGR
jgi:fatty-acyl-CoA synthase